MRAFKDCTYSLTVLVGTSKMAPAGRGALRPYQPSRFQPFLIACLLVTVVVVGYNFWNQMKKNSVLLAEIGRIQTTLRRIESERKVGLTSMYPINIRIFFQFNLRLL